MENNVNFKGAFLIKKPTPLIREALKPAVSGKQTKIFENFAGNNDILYVVSDNFDKQIATTLVTTPNVRFKYYSELKTTQFDQKNPEEAVNIVSKVKENIITTKNKLLEALRTKKCLVMNNNIKRIQERNLKLMEKETFLNFDDENYRKVIDTQNGFCRIFTYVADKKTGKSQRHTLLEITPPDKQGYCYAKYTPVSIKTNEDKTRRIVIKNGEKIFEYSEPASTKFKEHRREAKDYYQELRMKLQF